MRGKNTSSQWLILFRKIRPCKFTQQGGERFSPLGKSKEDSLIVSNFVKSQPDSPG